ncbi:MAG: oxidoreductase [Lachnospiraceae bacterium]|nr:oxidoreductase [Lachnospiraceae bacterium]
MANHCSPKESGCLGSSTMHYVSAAHGGWGIVRIAALVPESYLLFVCPFACGRHTALGGIDNGIKNQVSYLFITEADIVSGDFEQMIIDNVGDLFEALPKRPKVLFIFTSCLDDLLGTDHDAINAELSQMYPDVQFRHCKMNPISLDSSLPPGITLNMNMYSLLKKTGKKEKIVNIVGNNVTLPETGDLKQLLGEKGYKVYNVSDFNTFEEFSHMADACLNIVAGPIALKAAQQMEQELDIPYMKAFVNYDPEEIEKFYQELSDALGEDFVTPSKEYREKALEKIEAAKNLVGDYPVAIDYQAVLKPFSLGYTMARYGFNVNMIATDGVAGHEKANHEGLLNLRPSVLVENPVSHNAVTFPHEGEPYLCIGFDCGYMTGSDKVVNIMQDEGMYGYDGICRMMDMVMEAYHGGADVKTMIKEAKLII